MVNYKVKRFGWRKDRIDKRDYTPGHAEIVKIAKNSGCDCGSIIAKAPGMNPPAPFPPIKDNRKYCTVIKEQGELGSCTANAGCSMYEFLNKRHKKKWEPLSRLFLYKMTRDYMGEEGTGDSGAYLRTTLQALATYGTCSEDSFPYIISKFDDEPKPKHFAQAANYQATKYFRLDKGSTNNNVDKLQAIKTFITAEYPVVCGFNVYTSYEQAYTNGGAFPYPVTDTEDIVGGHAVLLVGFDENKVTTNETDGSQCKGAFIIQNSWGLDWAYDTDGRPTLGFGYLPYRYLHEGLADDFWSITRAEFVDTGQFK